MAGRRIIKLEEPDHFGAVQLMVDYFGPQGAEADEADAVSAHVQHLDADGNTLGTSWSLLRLPEASA
jgi:hypothetical protein